MNLAQIIDHHPADSTALRYQAASISFGQLRERSAAIRTALGARGVRRGDRVVLLLPTTPDFVAAYLATIGTGAVAVPLNPSSPPAELASEIETVGPKIVLTVESTAASLAGSLNEEILESLPRLEERAAGQPPVDVAEMTLDEPAVFLFTSGTAGTPKPAILTHGNLLANIEQVECRVGLAVTADDRGILVVPPFHIFGLNAVLGVQLCAGGPLVLVERFDPASLLQLVQEERVTVLAAVPQVFSALLEVPQLTGEELRSVRLACSGAAPLDNETAEKFESVFGVRIWQGYGLTEASPAVTFPDIEGEWRPASIGVPLPGVEVAVVDADGAPVEPGDPGEIWVRGPNVFAGYYEDQEATRAAVDRAGWLHTGDVAVMEEDGSLRIVDRHKDLIIVSGFNVFPAEVEQVIGQHPGVAEVAVIGVPDPVRGEAVKAYVVPDEVDWPAEADEPNIQTSEIIEFCSAHLAHYKCPTTVTFLRELPHGSGGKVLRRSLI